MSDEFLSSIKAGQYIKTQYRNDKPIVRKVTKLTRTQIVITETWYDDEPRTDRFYISNGYRINGYERWYDRTKIIPDPVSEDEAAAYESRLAENERFRKELKRRREVEAYAKARLFALFGECIPADNIKVNLNSDNGIVSCEIKCEKISEEDLLAALKTESLEEKEEEVSA